MKKISFVIAIAVTTFLAAFTTKQAGVWNMDKNHSKLGFTITHLMVSDVDGYFGKFDAKMTALKPDFSDASIEMLADMSSVNTDNEKRDAHLRSADFFDVAKYPTMIFKSTAVLPAGGQKYTIKGNLTMHGVTKPITLNAIIRQGVNPMSKAAVTGFKVTGTVLRSDFNIAPGYPSAALSNEVTINANAEFGKN